jgi:hypothetical protein
MYHCDYFQIGEVKIPLCMVDLAQTIEEWKDIQSVKVDDQVSAFFPRIYLCIFSILFGLLVFFVSVLNSKHKVRETTVYIAVIK